MGRLVSIVVVTLVIGLALATTAQDQLISYQGFLTDVTGEPVVDDVYPITFSLYSDSTDGIQLWSEIHSGIQTSAGRFTVLLGSVTPLSASVFETDPLFLQILIGVDNPVSPRTRIASTPRAVTAQRVSGDIATGPGYTHFKDPDGGTAMTIGTEGKGLPGFMTMYNPDLAFEGQSLVRMRSASDGGNLQFYVPGDVPPEPCIYMGVEPSPFRASLNFFDPGGTFPTDPYISMGVGPSTGAGIYMFNPQPEPPGEVFSLTTDFGGRASSAMELTDCQTNIQTKLEPGRVKVGSDTSDVMARGELQCGNDSTTFYIQGRSILGLAPAIGMLASGTEVKMGIGTLAPSAELHVEGDICYTGTIGACSDGRYKTDVHELTGSLDRVAALRGVNYRWRAGEYPQRNFDENQHIGFIAQEVEEVMPEVVQEHSDGTLSVDYGRLTPLLVEAIKELKQENEKLKHRLDNLERRQ